MAIDPVAVLIYELRGAQQSLAAAHGAPVRDSRLDECIADLETRIADLRDQLLYTAPTGPVGAAELIQVAANMLEASHGPYADQLRRIASRLSVGRRIPSDILWLRQMVDAVMDGLCGSQADAEVLLQLALKGATAPLVVFRAVEPPSSEVNDPDWDGHGRLLL